MVEREDGDEAPGRLRIHGVRPGIGGETQVGGEVGQEGGERLARVPLGDTGFARCGGVVGDGRAVAVGEEVDDPARVHLAGVLFAGGEHRDRTRQEAVDDLFGQRVGVAQLGRADGDEVPLRALGIVRDERGLAPEREPDTVASEKVADFSRQGFERGSEEGRRVRVEAG